MKATIRTKAGSARLAIWIALMAAALPTAAAETGDNAAAVDTSGWKCELCPFSRGYSGSVSAGVKSVSDSSNTFGNYTGYDDDKVYGGAGVQDLRYWGEKGYGAYADSFGYNADSFQLNFGAGRQGKWSADFLVDFLPVSQGEDTRTVYGNLDGSPQRLPADWVRAGSTSGMTALAGDLRDFDVEWDRHTFGVGGEYLFSPNFFVDLDYRYQTKEGKGTTWGTFLTNATQLTRPLDYETQEVDAGVTYAGDNWQVRAGFYGSWFSNKTIALTWDNAFNGPDNGRMANAPDNKAWNTTLSGSYRFMRNTTASATLSVGEGEQDDNFLPYTINPNIVTTPLPRSSYDGKIETTHAALRVTSTPWRRLRLTGEYVYDDRDNKSSSEIYDWVAADLYPANDPQQNFLYGYTRKDFELFGDYRWNRAIKTSLGVSHDVLERTDQEVDENQEDTIWAKVSLDVGLVNVDVRAATSDRDIDGDYQQVDYLRQTQNPLMRKYNMADRDRDGVEVKVTAQPSERLSMALQVESWDDNYDNSAVGLTSGDRDAWLADVSYAMRDNLSFYGSLGRESVKSTQWGAASNVNPNTAPPNWQGKNNDDFDSAGVGMRWSGLGRWGLELDYVYAKSEGKTELTGVALNDRFPKFETDLKRVTLGVTYDYSSRIRLMGGVLYEDYSSDNWAVDGVEPDTINSVLTWGGTSPDYDVTLLSIGFSYSFTDTEARDRILYKLQ